MKDHKELINQLSKLSTEQINPETIDIDELTPLEIVKKINSEDKKVALLIEEVLPLIAKAAVIFADTLKNNGRVFYIGAGTSGRLGVLDAAECPPTFGTDPGQIVGLISGGYDSLVLSKEGAEDQRQDAINDLQKHKLSKNDFVIGIAASVRTPYTRAGLEYANELGCKTAFIICNNSDMIPENIDVVIPIPVGPEVITGSTRMKSGTAQKMTLNMISTTAMVLLGKTYGNLMVDLLARSEKLRARSLRILIDLLVIDYDEAEKLLKSAEGSVKTAIVMFKKKCSREEALKLLHENDGFIKKIL
ncbi:MAG: N-acetylmuramic acid 6-phosphate etherase [bacterium]